MLSLVFSIIYFTGFTQNQVTYFYPDSTISSIGTINNGRPDGFWINYYPDGNIKSEGNWYKGLLDSTWIFYFHSGHIKLKIQYNQGIKNGYCLTYNFDKDSLHYLEKRELFVDGHLEGKVFDYFSNGTISSVTHYKSNSKTGEKIEFDTNGSPKSVYHYENNRLVSKEQVNRLSNGTKNGIWIAIDNDFNIVSKKMLSNDSVISEKSYENNIKVKYTIEGLEETFKDTAFQGQYIDNVPVGRHLQFDSLFNPVSYIIYDSLGNKLEEGKISNNKIHGLTIGYYLNQNIKYKGFYRVNRKHGSWKYFYPDGKLEQKGNFQSDKVHGEWIWFYRNGDTLRSESFKFNKRDGLYVSYDPYGNIIQKGFYENDLKQGEWIENTGEFVLKGAYFDDLKDGKWFGLYHNKEKAYIGNYLRGKPIGKHIYYYKSGNIRKIEYYESGRKTGYWQYFNKKGQLYKVKSYQKGEDIYIKD